MQSIRENHFDSPDEKQSRGDTQVYRLAVVQLECHPALAVQAHDLLLEPVAPDPKTQEETVISRLARHANFGRSSEPLLRSIRAEYLNWNERRLTAICDWFEKLSLQDCGAEIILFPEFAVPLDQLKKLKALSIRANAIVICGNHGHATDQCEKYEQLGIRDRKAFNELPKEFWGAAHSIFTIFYPDKEPYCRFKYAFSPMEMGIAFSNETNSPIKWTPPPVLSHPGLGLSIQSYICAEALRGVVLSAANLITVSAYHPKPLDFFRFAEAVIGNHAVFALASDGRWGGSRIELHRDYRMPEMPPGYKDYGMPPGDGILMMQVPRHHTGTGGGFYSIEKPYKLLKIAPILAMDETNDQYRSAVNVSVLLNKFSESLNLITNPDRHLRADIAAALSSSHVHPIQQGLYQFLNWKLTAGTLCQSDIQTLGDTCLFTP